jgi:hypothetical protein
MIKVGGLSSAVHAALLTSLMTALTRLVLAATLLLLTGLLPAATLLLTRARIALLRLARLRLVGIVHVLLLPAGGSPRQPCC